MYPIIRREQFGPTTFLWEVGAPDVARAARPGHFIMARIDEHGERIPLTVADFDAARGTVTVVIQAVGKTTIEMMGLRQGDYLLDFHRPARACPATSANTTEPSCWWAVAWAWRRSSRSFAITSGSGNRTVSIIGFRTRDLVFWEEPFREFSDRLEITTDDGSYGRKGFVTAALADVLRRRRRMSAKWWPSARFP